jgi:hypothetical protein
MQYPRKPGNEGDTGYVLLKRKKLPATRKEPLAFGSWTIVGTNVVSPQQMQAPAIGGRPAPQ